ncbi:MAG: thiamine pyrophosphate-binding protein [Acidimicrobiia bacterium]|nr:thiamine pyrophosphate-binding protein [Acidimicrobiia bacterium]
MPDFSPTPAAPATTATPTADPEAPHGGLLMARAMREAGVETVFSLCGGHIVPLLDGCRGAGIRVVDHRHEGAAALAAEGWALATGRAGVAAVTAGPGFANAVIGLVDAGVWSLPLVLVAGRTGLAMSGRGAVQDVDQRAIAAPVAKHAITCLETARLPRVVADALYQARAGRPGPVYLEVPQDVLSARAAPPDPEIADGYPATIPSPAGAPEDIEAALEILERAERPIVLAGGGVFWSGAGDDLARLAQVARMPVTTTSAARGTVPDSHPWCLGTLVHAGAALASADVVLVLGSAFNANVSFGTAPLFAPGQTVIQVDIHPERIGGNRRPDLALVGDVRRVVADLADAWRRSPPGRDAWLAEARDLTAFMVSTWDRQIDEHRGPRVHAGAAVRETVAFVREAVGKRVTFVADGGDALTWGLAYMYAEAPGRLLSTTTALGTLGVGLPFALGAAAARPDEPVVVFAGDGAFGLSAMELDTAVRHGLQVVCVVSNNCGWRDVSHEQDAWFGPGRRVASELADTRYDLLAAALGGHGEQVDTLDELRPALGRALGSGGPAVVNVRTDPEVLSDLLRNVGSMGLM